MSSTGGGIVVIYRSLTISGTKDNLLSLASKTADVGLRDAILAVVSAPPEIPPGGTKPE